eukprot:TRINITY_DN1276_c0_g1_i1.p1 TRINITY_DN1276_c0_g1~~TRINITY_DN1276_c0_g1_i1.p1  ORF type:complete len:311 (+),score=60.35 TRINITY_DN1276_c0_g1_i1:83-1015(+)
MKLIKKYIEKDGTGDVTLCPEDSEDLWHAYNLISEGDLIRATSIRKVQRESTTSTESERVRITLTISVETIHFDTASSILRLNGKNSAENKFVKMGAYHSLELELNKNFTITKPFWDSVTLERLEAACDPAKSADVGAVILQEGLANICLITNTMTIVRLRVEIPIPRKGKGGPEQHDKAMERFYEATLQGILRHFHFDILKCVIIASPGFVKDQLSEYIFTEALRRDLKVLTENKPKFVLAHSSSGHKYSLKEVMTDPSVAAKLSDTKAAGEVKCLNDFYDMLKTDPDRAFYDLKMFKQERNTLKLSRL